MRVLDCQCGRTLQAANDDELLDAAREHVEQEHPDMEMSDDQLRGMISEQAYSATDS
jgi:predicted small metal-binding protein